MRLEGNGYMGILGIEELCKLSLRPESSFQFELMCCMTNIST